ncbi:MAG: phage tail sheath family protein, partial [Acidimicrobiales bacterium]
IPPGGGVAGVVSRLDRERGPHHTPANAVIYEATDVVEVFDRIGQDQLYRAGINNLRCTPGRGIEIWGGRTLDRDPPGSFVAHRRLLHRLVRAAHRVAEPLVFDVNGPELWLTVVRALTTVLLEAYRSGGLKGLTPEEAFRVQCDEELNPPTERDDGRVLCLVSLAPASPMEFIVLRLTFGLQGALEVVEA